MNQAPSFPGIKLLDAHCHLYDVRFPAGLRGWGKGLPRIHAQVVNGTSPDDWDLVSKLESPSGGKLLKAYGVHPWKVSDLPESWEQQLRNQLESDAVSVGEIGLDNWIQPRNESLQRGVFMRQLELAAELGLPPSIHCVRAWGALIDCLRTAPEQPKGFLVHGFGGSLEVLDQLLDLGGFVSFSAYGAHPGRSRIRAAARRCPMDRILVETDAPDMVPPVEVCQFPLVSESGERLHHPAEILTAYECLSEWRGVELADFAEAVGNNFHRLFGIPEST